MKKHISAILIFLCTSVFSNAQEQEQGSIAGYFISYITENDVKTKNLDVMRGHIFVPHEKMFRPMKLNVQEINNLEQNRDSLFFISSGGIFGTLSSYFNVNWEPIIYERTLFPEEGNYTYKDKKNVYKSTFVEIQFLKKALSEKELIHIIAVEQYHFKNKNAVPVFFIRQITER